MKYIPTDISMENNGLPDVVGIDVMLPVSAPN